MCMNFSEFFIKKPVFCFVLASFLILVGYLSLKELPLRQFPDIERSEITIDTTYPGASSGIIETKITEFNDKIPFLVKVFTFSCMVSVFNEER